MESNVTDGEPAIVFSSKVEYGDEPRVELSVPRTWARQVAGGGWAVVAGRSVVDVLEWDDSVTPVRTARVRTALIWADYDARMHGWRAHADTRTCRVAWTSEGTASLVMPWGEPSHA
ncbi:hypothetical protein [Streptomyces virginiae]|uniref:hypothetical protein n=1 Tax=Streptomyces virginiae TaxID=1961 RepID=UPI00365FC208